MISQVYVYDGEARAGDGETPLHYAARKGHLHVVQYLCKRGASAVVRHHCTGQHKRVTLLWCSTYASKGLKRRRQIGWRDTSALCNRQRTRRLGAVPLGLKWLGFEISATAHCTSHYCQCQCQLQRQLQRQPQLRQLRQLQRKCRRAY